MFAASALVISTFAGAASGLGCYTPPAEEQPEFIVSRRSHEILGASDLPREFDWRNVHGTSFVTAVRNQQLPRICGSCWAHAPTSALSDRLLVLSGEAGVHTQLAPQVLLDLPDLPPNAGTCNGGDHPKVYEFIRLHGISDESCAPYQGVDVSTWGEDVSTTARMCRVCDWNGTCGFSAGGPRWGIHEHGRVLGVGQMMAEIRLRGPIACSIHAKNTIFNNYTGIPEIIVDDRQYTTTTHVIVILGWGISDNDVPYWIGKNSYGTIWGLEGFFKLRRGKNDLGLENHHCSWAVPYRRDLEPTPEEDVLFLV